MFAHLACSLLSPGGNVTSFSKVSVGASGVAVQYQGECMVNPLQAVRPMRVAES